MSDSNVRAGISRREAIRATSLAGAALAGMRGVHGQTGSSDVIRVGAIGVGGRGRGALVQALSVPGSATKLTALADIRSDNITRTLQAVEQLDKSKIDCPADRRYEGFDGYQKVLEHCDLVVIAAPPAFRPAHFTAAVKAGKHVFMEKPISIDAAGTRICLEAAKLADEKKLKVVVGLQRHYEERYRQTLAKVREGLAGDIISGQVYWNGDRPWWKARKPGQTELQYQIYNWGHFLWLCGDHIVEQHVHNIDVANWFLGTLPLDAYGLGGLQNREPAKPTQIYDHHTVTFNYPGGVKILSECRQFPGGEGKVTEEFQGTKGYVRIGEITDHKGNVLWKYDGPKRDPYQVEHDELQDAIRNDKPLNNAYYGTTSSFSSVLGRTATYTGKQVSYDDLLKTNFRTMPENLSWETAPPVMPDKDGNYPLPMPASYKIA